MTKPIKDSAALLADIVDAYTGPPRKSIAYEDLDEEKYKESSKRAAKILADKIDDDIVNSGFPYESDFSPRVDGW